MPRWPIRWSWSPGSLLIGCVWSPNLWFGFPSCTEWLPQRRRNIKPSVTSARSVLLLASGKTHTHIQHLIAFNSGFVKCTYKIETSLQHVTGHTQTPNMAAFCVVLSWLSIKGRSALEGRHLSKCQQLIHHWLNTIRRFAMKHTHMLTNATTRSYAQTYSARPRSQSSQRADWLANNP